MNHLSMHFHSFKCTIEILKLCSIIPVWFSRSKELFRAITKIKTLCFTYSGISVFFHSRSHPNYMPKIQ